MNKSNYTVLHNGVGIYQGTYWQCRKKIKECYPIDYLNIPSFKQSFQGTPSIRWEGNEICVFRKPTVSSWKNRII